ncbi:Cation/H(+) antiporter 1 [Linum perenne]
MIEQELWNDSYPNPLKQSYSINKTLGLISPHLNPKSKNREVRERESNRDSAFILSLPEFRSRRRRSEKMDAAKRAMCQADPFNPLITTSMQASGILVISHFFHLLLKPLGQPGPVAQVLAGVVLGPSLLSRIPQVKEFFIQTSSADYYEVFSIVFCVLFIFLISLETDISYIKRNFRKAITIAYGGLIVCGIFGIALSMFIIDSVKITTHRIALANFIMIILSNTAAPVVLGLATELKFATAEVGRLAVSASLVCEITCVLWFSVFLMFVSKHMVWKGFVFLFATAALVVVNRYLVNWCNRRNESQKYVTNTEVLVFLFLVMGLAFLIEASGFNSTISTFVVGLMFPKQGKSTRTLVIKLSYAVHIFVLPVYFGYIGFQFNVAYLSSFRNVIVVVLVMFLSTGGKIIGTLIACRYLKIPTSEGIVLAFLLNLKGHPELLLVGQLPKELLTQWHVQDVYSLVATVTVLNTLISGPAAALVLRKEEKYFSHKHTTLERFSMDRELRILACVYESRHISVKIGLIWALCGSRAGGGAPITAYLMHLIELPKQRPKKNLMYHELKDGDQFSDEEEYGGNDVMEINDAVDSFSAETKFTIRQGKLVSSLSAMCGDVCCAVEDLRISIVFMAFHKHQRLDGILERGKPGIRTINQKVQRQAGCSVGLFVDRGQTGFQMPSPDQVQKVAVIFFGGPDDREALACSKRMATHPFVRVTLVRFVQAEEEEEEAGDFERRMSRRSEAETEEEEEVLMEIPEVEGELCRYVAEGKVDYEEMEVKDGKETVAVLKEIGGMYSLFIVGKGSTGRPNWPMTRDISDWEECPELGTVGDLLASSTDMTNINASVLVIQQYRPNLSLRRD